MAPLGKTHETNNLPSSEEILLTKQVRQMRLRELPDEDIQEFLRMYGVEVTPEEIQTIVTGAMLKCPDSDSEAETIHEDDSRSGRSISTRSGGR